MYIDRHEQKELDALIHKLKIFCCNKDLPFFVSVAVSDTEYTSDGISAHIAGRTLDNRILANHFSVQSGFDVVPKYELEEMEMDAPVANLQEKPIEELYLD